MANNEFHQAIEAISTSGVQRESLKWIIIHLARAMKKAGDNQGTHYDIHCARSHLESFENILHNEVEQRKAEVKI